MTSVDSPEQTCGAIHGSVETDADQLVASFLPEPERTRSARNILLWQSYLPHDCVQTMISMGWDDST